jgi:hypothetical protein
MKTSNPSTSAALQRKRYSTRRPLYAMGVGAAVAALFLCATPGQASGDQTASLELDPVVDRIQSR